MAEQKTKQTENSVEKFLKTVSDEQKRKDCLSIISIMKQVTKHEPKMWGSAIIGFDAYHYKYASGHEGDAPVVGFSPRKGNIALYLAGAVEKNKALLEKLGKHKTGKGCLYLNKIEDVDQRVLKELVVSAREHIKKTYK